MSGKSTRRWFLIISGVLAVAVIPLAVVQMRNTRESASAVSCWGRFYGIATAMRQYEEDHGHLPPAYVTGPDGKPWHSWRVLLAEYMDGRFFSQYRFDEPWDSPSNRRLEAMRPSPYACPTVRDLSATNTSYFVVVGPNTAFPGARGVAMKEITRPHDQTLLLVEAVEQSVHWMEPKDLQFDDMSFAYNDPGRPSLSGKHRRGPRAFTAYWQMLWPASQGIGPDRLRTMLTIRE